MREYDEDDFLNLSGINHFKFCRRQWALIHIEKQWDENFLTAEGRILHEKVHDINIKEKRRNIIISRAMPVFSRYLGVSGECDVVEFKEEKDGVNIVGSDKTYGIYPVEYKRGRPKAGDCDISQLAAQAICLSEMFCCDVNTGYLYYFETKCREKVDITPEIRQNVYDTFEEMHMLFSKKYVPKAKRTKSCNACSLKDICLPQLFDKGSAKAYIDKKISECD